MMSNDRNGWIRSTHCGGEGQCVEVAHALAGSAPRVLVRDSKQGDTAPPLALAFTPDVFDAFTTTL